MIINCRNWIAGKFRGDEFPIQDKTSVNLFMDAIHGRKRSRLLEAGQLVAAALQATEGGDGSLFRIDFNAGGVAKVYGQTTHSHWLCGYTCCLGLDTYYYFCSGLVDVSNRHVPCPPWDRRTRAYRTHDSLRLIDICLRYGADQQEVDLETHVRTLQDLYDAHPLFIFGCRDDVRDASRYIDVFNHVQNALDEVFECPPHDTSESTPQPDCVPTGSVANSATGFGITSVDASVFDKAG